MIAVTMMLKEYIKNYESSMADFARKLKVSRGYLHNLVTGRRLPSARLATAIENLTGGKVRLRDFFREAA